MKRVFTIAFLLLLVLTLCGFESCSQKPEYSVRDGIAAAKGFIQDQQAQHLAECSVSSAPSAEPAKPPICAAINKAVAAQNLAIDALEIYCASPEFSTGNAECKPNKALEPKLQEAVASLNEAIAQIKALK